MPQIYVLTLKVAVTMPDAVDEPEANQKTAQFVRETKAGKWPSALPEGAVVEKIACDGPFGRRGKKAE